MKCALCISEGQTSRIYIGPTSSTCMGFSSYYGEDGKYHVHNPNYTSTQYSCSNGHSWRESTVNSCPSCDFGNR